MVQRHLGFVLPLALNLARLLSTVRTRDLSIILSLRSHLLQEGFRLSKVVDDRLVRNVADILHMIVGRSLVQFIRLSGVDSLQNAYTTSRLLSKPTPTGNPSETDPTDEWPVHA